MAKTPDSEWVDDRRSPLTNTVRASAGPPVERCMERLSPEVAASLARIRRRLYQALFAAERDPASES